MAFEPISFAATVGYGTIGAFLNTCILCFVGSTAREALRQFKAESNLIKRTARGEANMDDMLAMQICLKDGTFISKARSIVNFFLKCKCPDCHGKKEEDKRCHRRLSSAINRVIMDGHLPPIGPLLLRGDDPPLQSSAPVGLHSENSEIIYYLTHPGYRNSALSMELADEVLDAELDRIIHGGRVLPPPQGPLISAHSIVNASQGSPGLAHPRLTAVGGQAPQALLGEMEPLVDPEAALSSASESYPSTPRPADTSCHADGEMDSSLSDFSVPTVVNYGGTMSAATTVPRRGLSDLHYARPGPGRGPAARRRRVGNTSGSVAGLHRLSQMQNQDSSSARGGNEGAGAVNETEDERSSLLSGSNQASQVSLDPVQELERQRRPTSQEIKDERARLRLEMAQLPGAQHHPPIPEYFRPFRREQIDSTELLDGFQSEFADPVDAAMANLILNNRPRLRPHPDKEIAKSQLAESDAIEAEKLKQREQYDAAKAARDADKAAQDAKRVKGRIQTACRTVCSHAGRIKCCCRSQTIGGDETVASSSSGRGTPRRGSPRGGGAGGDGAGGGAAGPGFDPSVPPGSGSGAAAGATAGASGAGGGAIGGTAGTGVPGGIVGATGANRAAGSPRAARSGAVRAPIAVTAPGGSTPRPLIHGARDGGSTPAPFRNQASGRAWDNQPSGVPGHPAYLSTAGDASAAVTGEAGLGYTPVRKRAPPQFREQTAAQKAELELATRAVAERAANEKANPGLHNRK